MSKEPDISLDEGNVMAFQHGVYLFDDLLFAIHLTEGTIERTHAVPTLGEGEGLEHCYKIPADLTEGFDTRDGYVFGKCEYIDPE